MEGISTKKEQEKTGWGQLQKVKEKLEQNQERMQRITKECLLQKEPEEWFEKQKG